MVAAVRRCFIALHPTRWSDLCSLLPLSLYCLVASLSEFPTTDVKMNLQEEKLDHAEEIDEKDTSGTGYTHVEDPVLENKIVRHLDRRILPWLFALWLLAFIDRSSIGNAKIDGLIDDLNLTGNKYNISLTVFYILYVLVDIPSNWLLKVVGGGRYLPMLALAWGIVGTCMGAVKSYPALIACRMLLGACEGGMFGGIILYLSMFYKRHQLMFRLGVSTFRFAQRV